MSISENIAKYRKRKGYTQEQLGEILGVTNQEVSKWESAVSMPDVMLLPQIADARGITLNDLYGIAPEPDDRKDRNERINEFPASAQNLIKKHLCQQLLLDTQCIGDIAKIEIDSENTAHINAAYTLGIIPYRQTVRCSFQMICPLFHRSMRSKTVPIFLKAGKLLQV